MKNGFYTALGTPLTEDGKIKIVSAGGEVVLEKNEISRLTTVYFED